MRGASTTEQAAPCSEGRRSSPDANRQRGTPKIVTDRRAPPNDSRTTGARPCPNRPRFFLMAASTPPTIRSARHRMRCWTPGRGGSGPTASRSSASRKTSAAPTTTRPSPAASASIRAGQATSRSTRCWRLPGLTRPGSTSGPAAAATPCRSRCAVREVIAVDPSEGMLGVLRDGMAEHSIENVRVVHGALAGGRRSAASG